MNNFFQISLVIVFVQIFSLSSFAAKVEYGLNEVQVILSCDDPASGMTGWYVLGRVGHDEAKLFFRSRGKYIYYPQQINLTGRETGEFYEFRLDYLIYHFNLTRPGDYTLLIRNQQGKKIDLLSCELNSSN